MIEHKGHGGSDSVFVFKKKFNIYEIEIRGNDEQGFSSLFKNIKIGALDAVRELTYQLQFGGYNYVVEADIKGFFNNIDHEWMIKMLEERIDDKPFVRLIQKWLKAGILEEGGEVLYPVW